jgi:hypothetical protein
VLSVVGTAMAIQGSTPRSTSAPVAVMNRTSTETYRANHHDGRQLVCGVG